MTEEDGQLICDYMGWNLYKYQPYYLDKNGNIEKHEFDINDASLVVKEMQKREEWKCFLYLTDHNTKPYRKWTDFVAWLTTMEDGQAKNFFKAFTEWRKGK